MQAVKLSIKVLAFASVIGVVISDETCFDDDARFINIAQTAGFAVTSCELDAICTVQTVADACKLTCGLCTLGLSTGPSMVPSINPTMVPSMNPTMEPSTMPSMEPTIMPSLKPSMDPTKSPSMVPSMNPTMEPSTMPSMEPTIMPSLKPSMDPTKSPSMVPSMNPTMGPSMIPSMEPSMVPSVMPSMEPTIMPSAKPSMMPTMSPTAYRTYVLGFEGVYECPDGTHQITTEAECESASIYLGYEYLSDQYVAHDDSICFYCPRCRPSGVKLSNNLSATGYLVCAIDIDYPCVHVNHIYDRIGYYTCDCVPEDDPCLSEWACEIEPNCLDFHNDLSGICIDNDVGAVAFAAELGIRINGCSSIRQQDCRKAEAAKLLCPLTCDLCPPAPEDS